MCDTFIAGDSNVNKEENIVYKPDEGEPNHWAKLIDSCKKLQVLFMRASGLTDADMAQICVSLKTNSSIKVLDISSNTGLTVEATYGLVDVMTANRALEYLGMSKLNLEAENVKAMFDGIGRFPFPAEEVEN